MRRTKKKNDKFYFVQDWGTYSDQTLVAVGMSHDDIIKANKKLGGKKEFAGWLEEQRENFKEAYNGKGFFATGQRVGTLLWLREFRDKWENYETLMHELHHACHEVLGNRKLMQDEREALAYQQEFLFREIRRRLQDHFGTRR